MRSERSLTLASCYSRGRAFKVGVPFMGRRLYKLAPLLVLMVLGLAQAMVRADEVQDRRARIGLSLFRTMLSADLGLPAKADSEGRLPLLLVYKSDAWRAQAFANELAQPAGAAKVVALRDLPLAVSITPDLSPEALEARSVAGILILEDLSDTELMNLVRYGNRHRIIVFSTIEGHVEKGVLGGLSIEVRALPVVNDETLRNSGVQLKELFLKIAKHYD